LPAAMVYAARDLWQFRERGRIFALTICLAFFIAELYVLVYQNQTVETVKISENAATVYVSMCPAYIIAFISGVFTFLLLQKSIKSTFIQ
jgi:hypothetical protein